MRLHSAKFKEECLFFKLELFYFNNKSTYSIWEQNAKISLWVGLYVNKPK